MLLLEATNWPSETLHQRNKMFSINFTKNLSREFNSKSSYLTLVNNYIFYIFLHFLPWYHFTAMMYGIFFPDIILLPWCDIFYLDIIWLPWWNIFFLDIILLPCRTVMWHFLPWYHLTTVMENFLRWYHFTSVMDHFLP